MKEDFNSSEEFENMMGTDPDAQRNHEDENWERHESEVVDPAEESMYEEEKIKPGTASERNPKKMRR